jgi:hypothetical protein
MYRKFPTVSKERRLASVAEAKGLTVSVFPAASS